MAYFDGNIELKQFKNKIIDTFGESKGSFIINFGENLFEDSLKDYAKETLDYYMGDDFFWDEDTPVSDEDRIKEVYDLIFEENELFDPEVGWWFTDDGWEEMFYDTLEATGTKLSEEEQEWIKELCKYLHIAVVQEEFKRRFH